jgi:hypothetical protein
MKPSTVIDTAGHKLYHTYIVGQYCGDPLLKTPVDEGSIYQFGKSGVAVAFPAPGGFVEREQERRDALEEMGCRL